MKFIIEEILSVKSLDTTIAKKKPEHSGLLNIFIQHISNLIRHSTYIDDFPTVQALLDPNSVASFARHLDEEYSYDELLKRIQYCINFFRREHFLEIIPSLSLEQGKITCFDHIIINKIPNSNLLNISTIIKDSIQESIEQARTILRKNYTINAEKLKKAIINRDPLYFLYLPYYFLMEQFRTEIDPEFSIMDGYFKTISRNKQTFLNNIYSELVRIKIFNYDSHIKDITKLHSYFHFSWYNNNEFYNIYIKHYINLFKMIVNYYLNTKTNSLYYKNNKDSDFQKIMERIIQQKSLTAANIFYIIKILLVQNQGILLSNSKDIHENQDLRFLRNALVELMLHNRFVAERVKEKINDLKQQGIELLDDESPESNSMYDISKINLNFFDRSAEVLSLHTKELEKLRTTLSNPVHYRALFNNSANYPDAVYSFNDLLDRYIKIQDHFTNAVKELNTHSTPEKQLLKLLQFYAHVNLIVHIKLPYHSCKESRIENHWYAESLFWNNNKEKEKAKEYFRKLYASAQSGDETKVYDEWLKYLSLSVNGANIRSSK